MSTPPDPSAPVERRLATILVADVFGYSRMMGEDEERTVRTLRGHRAVFDDLLKTYRGRVFNTAGDAILAEFPSAVDAVRCATEIQSALRTRNEQLPEDHRMWFRIGVNLGDVIVQDGDLLGDGVNIAARIEAATEPGGVCISGSVYDQIQNKLSLTFRQLPDKAFKNIAQPVRTFAIGGDAPPVVRGAPRASWLPRAAAAAGLAAAAAEQRQWAGETEAAHHPHDGRDRVGPPPGAEQELRHLALGGLDRLDLRTALGLVGLGREVEILDPGRTLEQRHETVGGDHRVPQCDVDALTPDR